MKNHIRNFISILFTLPVLLLLTSQVCANELPEFNADEFWFDTAGTQVDVVTPFEFESMELRVRKRGETEVWTESFGPGLSLSVDLAHVVQSGLTDDRYTYEVRFVLGYRASDPTDLEAAGAEEPITYSTSGTFTVQDGSITDISIPGHRSPGTSKGGTVQSDSGLEATSDSSSRDISNSGDLAMGGYAVFGSDNLGNVIPGKVRIRATGSGSSAYSNVTVESNAANNDLYAWHFGTQGGDLGIQRQRTAAGAKVTVLGIEEDAPESSLVIASSGRIGMGTATPANRLHIVSSETFPGIKLEHSSSGGSGGVIHDSANRLRFRIDGITRMTLDGDNFGIGTVFPTERLHVLGNARITGSVGIGAATPSATLHVRRTNGTAGLLIEETQAIATNTMFEMRHNGNPGFQLNNTSSGVEWQFRLGGSGATEQFTVNKVGTGQPEASFLANGNLQIRGTLSEGSSRALKQDIVTLEPQDILERLHNLQLTEWSYIRSPESRHFGPMAEDFYELFGLGAGPTSISPRDLAGIALATSKALVESNRRLQSDNQQLSERIESLEKAFLIIQNGTRQSH